MLASAVGPGERARGITRRARAHPLVTVATTYVVLRLADLVIFGVVARSHGVSIRRLLMSWDAGWYLRSALEGYPKRVPTDAAGHALQSTMNWPPVLPSLGRLGALLLPAHPSGAASAALLAASIAGGLAAAVLLCATLLPAFGASRAIGSAVLWSALPATPVLVMGYAEGLFCALAFASLLAATRHRYVLAGALLVPAGLTRVTVLPFAVALVVAMYVDHRRSGAVSTGLMWLVGGLAAMGSVAWPALVAWHDGSLNAFAFSQSAWARSSVPFAETAQWVWDAWQEPTPNTFIALTVLVAYGVAAFVVARDRHAPVAIRVLAAVAPAFVLASGAVSSTARYFVPDPALAIAIRRGVRRFWAVVLTVALLLGMHVAWILVFVAAPPGSPPP